MIASIVILNIFLPKKINVKPIIIKKPAQTCSYCAASYSAFDREYCGHRLALVRVVWYWHFDRRVTAP
jgi:hypothetical protein